MLFSTAHFFADETEGKFQFQVYLKYLGSTDKKPWLERNPTFVDAVRKQLLIWRGFTEEEKEKYVKAWDQQTRPRA